MIAAQMGQQLLSILELRHDERIAQIGDFNVPASGKDELIQVVFLGPGGDKLLLMLKPVPDCYVPNGHLAWHAGKDIP
jgi:hypothetical protein